MDKCRENLPFSAAPPIAILGVPFDTVTTGETIRAIEQMVASGRPHYLATANVDFLVQAAHDVELRRILFDAHLVLCDGTPLVWASRVLGNPLPERVAGSDLVPLLLSLAARKGYRPFFLGATPDAIETAVARTKRQYPNIQFAGCYSPPFNKLLEMDHEGIRERIIAARPDLLFVGFGCPKQEKWIYMHYRSLGVPVSVGIGGTIDFIAGKLARAPLWMQKSGTEWVFRLAQEPRRLLKRYARDLWYFSRAIASQYWSLRRRRIALSQTSAVACPQPEKQEFQVVVFPERLDFETVHQTKDMIEMRVSGKEPVIADLRNVQFIDSTGVGFLIRLQKQSRELAKQLILAGLTRNVHRALELMRLEEFFVIVPDIESARNRLRERNRCAAVQLKTIESAALPAIAWIGELTAANAEEVWISTMDHLAARALVQRTVAVDLSRLTFIDSTGVGVMIRAKKYAARQGLTLQFTGAGRGVLNVLRLSRLEDYLLPKNE